MFELKFINICLNHKDVDNSSLVTNEFSIIYVRIFFIQEYVDKIKFVC